MSLEITKTERGNVVLTLEGHQYIRRVDRRGPNGEFMWRCRKSKKFHCNATVKTDSTCSEILNDPTTHCHSGDVVDAEMKNLQSSLRESAASSNSTTRNVLGEALTGVHEDVLERLPKRSSLEANIRAKRRKDNPVLSEPTSRNFSIPPQYAGNVLFDTGSDDNNRILILGDTQLLSHMQSANTLLGDGTFDVAPSMYFQLYTLHCKVGNSYPPCIYALLPNKTGATYSRMLRILHVLLGPINPQCILLDFELAAINSFQEAFPNAEIKGCFFHLSQSVIRKVSETGLKKQFETDRDFSLKVKSLFSLSFVPLAELDQIFGQLADTFDENPANNELLAYFNSTYVSGTQVGNRTRPARYPPALWNYFENEMDAPKTTNAVEGFHNALQGMVQCKHPSIWKFLEGITKDIAVHKLTSSNASVQLLANRRNKYVILADRLARKISEYDAETDKLHYLRAIANMQAA